MELHQTTRKNSNKFRSTETFSEQNIRQPKPLVSKKNTSSTETRPAVSRKPVLKRLEEAKLNSESHFSQERDTGSLGDQENAITKPVDAPLSGVSTEIDTEKNACIVRCSQKSSAKKPSSLIVDRIQKLKKSPNIHGKYSDNHTKPPLKEPLQNSDKKSAKPEQLYKLLEPPNPTSVVPRKPARPPIVNLQSATCEIKGALQSNGSQGQPTEVVRPISLLTEEQENDETNNNSSDKQSLTSLSDNCEEYEELYQELD